MPRSRDDQLIIKAGEIFAETKNAYVSMMRSQGEADEMTVRAETMMDQVRQMVADPALAAESRAEAEALLAEAEVKLGEIQAQDRKIAQERVVVLMRTVNSMGSTIARLRGYRETIVLVDPADFDLRFDGLQARYDEVYRPLFPVGPGGIITVPDVAAMTKEDWQRLHTHAEGPLLLWDIAECREKWPIGAAAVPACKGPDFLEALSMVNQIHEALLTQIELREDFPLLSFFDDVLGGFVTWIAEAVQGVRATYEEFVRLVKAIGKIAHKVIEGAADIAETVAKAPGMLLLAAAAGGAYLLMRRRRA